VVPTYSSAAEAAVKEIAEPVPLHLRHAPTGLMKQLEYGKGYRYAHDEPGAVADMECLPAAHRGRRFYDPTDRGREAEIRERLETLRKQRE
jgi:putative ATPase